MLHRSVGQKLLALPGSVLWALGALLATLLFGTIGILVAMFLPYRGRYWLFIRWSFFLLWWARICCGIHHQVEGTEHIPDRACIVMCKHQSAWETLATQYWFHPQTWVLKRELMKIPLIGWALGMLQPIAIDRSARKKAMEQMLEQGRERIREGRWIIIFPEGTRIPAGRAGRYRPGGAILSADTGVPIIPVAHNAGECWPRNSFLKYPGRIRVRIGPAIDPKGRDADVILDEVRDWIETNTRAISTVYETPSDAG
ncbi:MAG: 1-acyl-sn-glycerol-3-phosphate acyltransferase [Ectothiorhodospiraceae bacterium]|nr:1-acyl-sn-glycerol-3-phosphate acyltransferase [Ectothiorhodospiraceae bacterium]